MLARSAPISIQNTYLISLYCLRFNKTGNIFNVSIQLQKRIREVWELGMRNTARRRVTGVITSRVFANFYGPPTLDLLKISLFLNHILFINSNFQLRQKVP